MIQLGFAPALVLALPLLGQGMARAGYVSATAASRPVTLSAVGQPPPTTSLGEFGDPGLSPDEGCGRAPAESQDKDGALARLHPFGPLYGLFHPNTGGASGTDTGGPGGSSAPQAGLSSAVDVARPQVTVRLFLARSAYKPNPFVSSLFRPPRRAA